MADGAPRLARGLRSVLLAAGLAAAACKGDRAAEATTTATQPAGHATEIVALELGPAPTIAVLDRGQTPDGELVRTLAPGSNEALRATLSSRLSGRLSGQAIDDVALPILVLDGRVDIDAVSEETIATRWRLPSVKVEGEAGPSAATQAMVAGLTDTFAAYRAALRLDPHGGVREGSIELPTGASEMHRQILHQLTDALGQFQIPLPPGPLGVGARWRVDTRVHERGLSLQQRVDYELVEREGDHVVVTATVRQSPLSTTVALPGGAATAKVERFRGTGDGRFELDLRRLVPRHAEVSLHVQMVLTLEQAGSQEIELHLDASIDGTTAE